MFIFLVALGSGSRRRRMSHNNGAAGRGKVRIVDDPEFPETEFFEAGREFPCRLRHAAVAYWDDSMHVARSATLKFADTNFESPFYVQMNSDAMRSSGMQERFSSLRSGERNSRESSTRSTTSDMLRDVRWLHPRFG